MQDPKSVGGWVTPRREVLTNILSVGGASSRVRASAVAKMLQPTHTSYYELPAVPELSGGSDTLGERGVHRGG